MPDLTTGWITYYRIRLADGRTVLVQKRDGATRHIVTTGRGAA